MKDALRLISRTGFLLSLAVIATCSMNQVDMDRVEALDMYQIIIRWSEWDAAANYISAEYQKERRFQAVRKSRRHPPEQWTRAVLAARRLGRIRSRAGRDR